MTEDENQLQTRIVNDVCRVVGSHLGDEPKFEDVIKAVEALGIVQGAAFGTYLPSIDMTCAQADVVQTIMQSLHCGYAEAKDGVVFH